MSLVNPTPITPASQGVAIGNANLPAEGPKAIPYVLDFTAQPAYGMDLTYLFSQKLISMIQTIWIDNSASLEETVLVLQGTQQKVICPAGFQGYFPVMSPTFGKIVCTGSGAVVPVFLINVPISSLGGWYPAQTASDFTFNNGGSLQVSDPALESLINARTTGEPALDVNVVFGGGGSATLPSTLIGAAQVTNGGFQVIVGQAPSGLRWYITAMSVLLSGDAVGSVSELTVRVDSQGGDFANLFSRKFSVPTTAPTSPMPNQVLLEFTGLLRQSDTIDRYDIEIDGGTLTTGFVDVQIWGYAAA